MNVVLVTVWRKAHLGLKRDCRVGSGGGCKQTPRYLPAWDLGRVEGACLRLRRQVKLEADLLGWRGSRRPLGRQQILGWVTLAKVGKPFRFMVRLYGQRLSRKYNYFRHLIPDPCLQ